jgi:hypothetical protein
MDGPGIESRWDFPHPSRPALRPIQPHVQWVPEGCGFDHPSHMVFFFFSFFFFSSSSFSFSSSSFFYFFFFSSSFFYFFFFFFFYFRRYSFNLSMF